MTAPCRPSARLSGHDRPLQARPPESVWVRFRTAVPLAAEDWPPVPLVRSRLPPSAWERGRGIPGACRRADRSCRLPRLVLRPAYLAWPDSCRAAPGAAPESRCRSRPLESRASRPDFSWESFPSPFKKHSPKSRLAARKRNFGRKEISECGKLGKTTSGGQTGYVPGFYPSVFSTLPQGLSAPPSPSFRLFWLFWGAKKGDFFWVEARKVG